jgi:PLP dependent protein
MIHKDEIRSRLDDIRSEIEKAAIKSGRKLDDITLVAVTKTHPAETVQALVDLGIHDIGENRVQEIAAKAPVITGDITWHMVGHLQRNKVKKALEHVAWIQSIDSDRLADEVEESAGKISKKVKALVEVNTSGEISKSGCEPSLAIALCEKVAACKNLEFCGLMTIGPLIGGEAETRKSFQMLRGIGEKVKNLAPKIELSMGMSNDFSWAVEEGATIVRIGTRLLGDRK